MRDRADLRATWPWRQARASSLTPVTAAAAREPRHHYLSAQAVDQRHRDAGMLPIQRHIERSVGHHQRMESMLGSERQVCGKCSDRLLTAG